MCRCTAPKAEALLPQTHWTSSWTHRKFHEVGGSQHQEDIMEWSGLEKTSEIIKFNLPKYTGRSNLCTVKNWFFRAAKLSYCSGYRIHEEKKHFNIWKKKGTLLSNLYKKHNSVGNPANPQCTQFSALPKLKVWAINALPLSRRPTL